MLRIAIAQLNPVVGDIAGNLQKAREARAEAALHKADLIVFSELFISGYPTEDLVLLSSFVKACERAIADLAKDTADQGPGVIIGTPINSQGEIYNSVVVLDEGKIIAERHKVDLPNYGEFDEKRVFSAGDIAGPVNFRGVRLGLPICEDIWGDLGVVEALEETGAEIIIVANASPYHRDKMDGRYSVALRHVIETELPIIYVNQLGGQDELLFDGGSFVFNADKALALQLPQFVEQIIVTDWVQRDGKWACEPNTIAALPDALEADYSACVLGLRDYVNKNGFKTALLGLSGGLDSALCAAIAVDALGADRVRCVMMPYHFTTKESHDDAANCAKALGVSYEIVPIAQPVESFLSTLEPIFAGYEQGITEENLQSRTRGVILMAISNKFGSLLITTGNKSEMAVGYATLYGDMNGGFNPIKDIYKTRAFALSEWRNKNKPVGALGPDGEVIPANIITKVPSAELRENQTDQDSLPPYPVLDEILEMLVEQGQSVEAVVAKGHAIELVQRIEQLLLLAEYKRRQSAPGVKVSSKNFGKDRRYPITNRFRDR